MLLSSIVLIFFFLIFCCYNAFIIISFLAVVSRSVPAYGSIGAGFGSIQGSSSFWSRS